MIDKLNALIQENGGGLDGINAVREALGALSPLALNPVDFVQWVPIEKITPNDYNPNSVARVEMGLLLTSIMSDGYTQPVVTIYDEKQDKYVIVDGFHRYYTMKSNSDLYDKCGGMLPVVVIKKDINERMASTVRHNRARGKHSISGLANMVFAMLDNGMNDSDVCNELGMEAEELLRLKHITGFSKLFEDTEYSRAWITRQQARIKQAHLEKLDKLDNEEVNQATQR